MLTARDYLLDLGGEVLGKVNSVVLVLLIVVRHDLMLSERPIFKNIIKPCLLAKFYKK